MQGAVRVYGHKMGTLALNLPGCEATRNFQRGAAGHHRCLGRIRVPDAVWIEPAPGEWTFKPKYVYNGPNFAGILGHESLCL